MALTGELIYRGLTISNSYLRVVECDHRVKNTSTTAEDGTVTWSKTLRADYVVRVYKDASSCASNPNESIYSISGSFIPSVANSVNLNIVKQTYIHLKTLADYDDLTDDI